MIHHKPNTAFTIATVDGRFMLNAFGCAGVRARITDDFSALVEVMRDELNNDSIAHAKEKEEKKST